MSIVPLLTDTPVPQANASLVDSAALEQELRRTIAGEVRFDKISRALYSNDASVYEIEPLGVVIVKNRDDILHTLEICRRFHCPLTMRGGGTSQAGQSVGAGIQVDTAKYYNQLLELNAAESWVRVEPGIVLDELNAQLAAQRLRFAPDISTASRATIGGMIANNSSGTRSILYGKTIDHVLELVVALSDGSVIHCLPLDPGDEPRGDSLEAECYRVLRRLSAENAAEIERRFPKVLRRVAGYNLDEFADPAKPLNLAKLIVGSEGTLGIVLEAKLKLVPLPKAKAVMVIEFADLLESLAATPLILEHGPSAVEVMDKAVLDNTRQNPALDGIRKTFIAGDPAATLYVEFYGERQEDLPARTNALREALVSRGFGYAYHFEGDPARQAQIWGLREAALGLTMAIKTDAKSISFVEDTAVPPEKLSAFIDRFLTIVRDHGTTAGVYAHASVGCLHVRPVVNMKTEEGVAMFASIAQHIADLVLEFGGALSGEHGDGMVRASFMKQMFGPALYQAFREIKRTFDPLGILNPGKIVDAPPLTSNLRFGAGYKTQNPETWFDYSEYGGFGGAVEMCSGVGACRKKLSGVMCPSYMATRDEADTTRGRANVLRLAMNGRLGGQSEEAVYQVLDLCLECRACKTECPVGVDMARFKSEFLASFWKRHGTPLHARALGNIGSISRWISPVAPIANLMVSSGPGRWLMEKMMGVNRHRRLPHWSSQTFRHWAMTRDAGGHYDVTLFNDTFTNYFSPEIGIAAVAVLQRAGRKVRVATPGCCGRPLISKGLLDQARARATRTCETLFPIAEHGEKILFCEPSCLSAVKEDFPSLLRGEMRRKAQAVAAASQLFEEYASQLNLRMQAGPQTILLHGHCHQKSMGLLPATVSLLSQIPGARVVDLDAGCCGMAGSFGYATQHQQVSEAIANRKLIPSVLKRSEGDVVVAVGTSCRHQLHELANVTALHPAMLVQRLLE